MINEEKKKPIDASDVNTPRGESAKEEVKRLRKLIAEMKDGKTIQEAAVEEEEAAAEVSHTDRSQNRFDVVTWSHSPFSLTPLRSRWALPLLLQTRRERDSVRRLRAVNHRPGPRRRLQWMQQLLRWRQTGAAM